MEKTRFITLLIFCAIVPFCIFFIPKSNAATYNVPKASDQPKGKTYMYSKTVVLTDKYGHKVHVKEYTATNGKKYIVTN
jgi:hypothetical protein